MLKTPNQGSSHNHPQRAGSEDVKADVAPLQFADRGTAPTGKKTPYGVLAERRPDITNLPLTCENTNTALPYIDVVNEILEYWVAKAPTSH